MPSVRGLCAGAAILFLATYHLADYPVLWFDEGSYLHVAKALARFGVYADYSSEGFRYVGPPVGAGPPFIVPVAVVFRLFGVGLIQARLVVVAYCLATLAVFVGLAQFFGGTPLAWIVTALLVSSRGAFLLSYGRQGLAEVPALFFLAVGLLMWLRSWERAGVGRLVLVGVALGFAAITKHHFLLFIAPALVLSWLANLVYYRAVRQRVFVVPLLTLLVVYTGLWATYLVYIGPQAAQQVLRTTAAETHDLAGMYSGAAIERALREILGPKAYLGWLLPALIYGLFCVAPRQRNAQQWGVVLAFALGNFGWLVAASVGWPRYALAGFALGSLFVGRLFLDLLSTLRTDAAPQSGEIVSAAAALRSAVAIALVLVIVLPLGETLHEIIRPPRYGADAMATYLNDHVPLNAVIETWEHELGLLTDHQYHFPPYAVLTVATNHVWRNGPAPTASYHPLETERPPYVIVGPFAMWVNLYPRDFLETHYTLITKIGAYELFALRELGDRRL